jgi:hypothetical protein
MADRLDALGGNIDLVSPRGKGSVVPGRVPIAIVAAGPA